MLSEVNQTLKDDYCTVSLKCGTYNVKFAETVEGGFQGLGGGGNGKMLIKGYKLSSYEVSSGLRRSKWSQLITLYYHLKVAERADQYALTAQTR